MRILLASKNILNNFNRSNSGPWINSLELKSEPSTGIKKEVKNATKFKL